MLTRSDLASVLWCFVNCRGQQNALKEKYGVLMTDNEYNDGILRTIAHKINEKTDKKIHVMGLQHKTAGHHSKVDNLPPDTSKIIKKVLKIIK